MSTGAVTAEDVAGTDTILFRLVGRNPPTDWDFLSQAARKQPPPRRNPPSEHDWAGLSMFTSYESVRKLGILFNWKHGEVGCCTADSTEYPVHP